MAISSPGIGSNLDVNSIVSQLMALERQPLTRLTQKEAGYQAKLSAYGSIQGALSSFQTSMSGLANASKYTALSATVSDATVATASASSISSTGSYSMQVDKLAQKQSLVSNAFTDTTSVVGSGTINIQFGEFDGSSFTQNTDKASFNITIDSSNNSLSGIRDAINKANAGVTASIINTGSGYKLSLTSNDTGLKSTIKLTVEENTGLPSDNTDTSGLSKIAYDPAAVSGSGKNMSESQAASNAELTVNGITIAKQSNTITDVIQGVTLTLNKTTASGSPVQINIGRDTASVSSAASDFVKAFNDLNNSIRSLTGYDAETKQAGLLQGESTPNSILNQIRGMMRLTSKGLDGTMLNLSQLGITFQKSGALAFDSSKLNKLVESNPEAISGFFASTGLATDENVKFISKTSATTAGRYEVSISQLATQGNTAGSSPANLTITAGSNDEIISTVDGTTVTIKLQAKTYTAVELAGEVQSKLNGALAATGKSVAVSNSSGTLGISSSSYGTESKISIAGNGADDLLGVGRINTDGTNVAGQINGTAASGSGQILTAENGLKLNVAGSSIGDRGFVNVSEGFAQKLGDLAGQLLADKGSVSSAQTGLKALIKDITNREAEFSRRLVSTEARYRAQFTALDTLLGKMSSTSAYLTQQLASLSSLNS